MRFVIQRVLSSELTIDSRIHGHTGKGLVVLAGICDADTEAVADRMIRKLTALRIFEDENGKTNLDIMDAGGNILFVSQFTLYADCKKGNRPSFFKAGSPEHANKLYEYMLDELRKTFPDIQHGEFGADMKIALINDGPFTIVLDSDDIT